MEKISVIIPVYNAATTLPRCLDSVLAQKGIDFEVLAVDDASTDNSWQVLQDYAAKDTRVKIYTKAHGGVSAARNFGLREANGSLIQFVDADDHIEPDMLKVMSGLIAKYKADIALCHYTHPSIRTYLKDRVIDLTRRSNQRYFMQHTFAIHVPWNKMYRREVLQTPYDEEVTFSEDGLFGLANLFHAKKLAVTERELYHYDVADENTPEEKLSCINKIAKANDFWKTKVTYWYLIDELKDKYRAVLEENLPANEVDDFLYLRIFDFMLWELLILGCMGVDPQGLTWEISAILAEPDFIRSICVKEKYGISLRPMTSMERDRRAAEFVELGLALCKENDRDCKGLRLYYLLLDLYAAIFVIPNGLPMDCSDFLARAVMDVSQAVTPEAARVSSLLAEHAQGNADEAYAACYVATI